MNKFNLKMIIYASMACVFVAITAFNLKSSTAKVDVSKQNLAAVNKVTASATPCKYEVSVDECDRKDEILIHNYGDCWCGNFHEVAYEEQVIFYAIASKCNPGDDVCGVEDCVFPQMPYDDDKK